MLWLGRSRSCPVLSSYIQVPEDSKKSVGHYESMGVVSLAGSGFKRLIDECPHG